MSGEKTGKGFSLKDQLFNKSKICYLAGLFKAADANFDEDGFVAAVMKDMLPLELKARINLIAEVLADHLSDDFPTAAAKVVAALPPPLDPTLSDDDFGDFIFAPLGVFISTHGINQIGVALPALYEMTKRFTVEYDIRHFLNAHPSETMIVLAKWATDDNYHVRRLVTEGTRPSLPWGVKIGLDYHDPMKFLDILHRDRTRFVTRSVANHLNDIAKRDPDLVVETLARWKSEGRQDAKEMAWMTSHALRVLVKKGHQGALELLGYRAKPMIKVSSIAFPKDITIGDTGKLDVTITAQENENLMIDFVIDFVKKNGSTAPKVFKLKKLSLKAGESVSLTKTHRFLKNATTFTHYTGTHKIYMQINGQQYTAAEFELK